jgi:acyl-CoA hydrolase
VRSYEPQPPVPEPRDLRPKPVAASVVTLTQLMEVTDANILGNVHGGVVMRLVDTAAALAAAKHAGGICVTVTIDELSFLEPVHVGEVLTLHASVNGVGTTSLEVGVRVEAENVVTGRHVHAATAYLVFVAVDDEGQPRPVPPLRAETEEERRREGESRRRREVRMAHKAELHAARERDAAP